MGQAFVSTGSQTVPVEGTLLENVEIKINNGESDLDHYIIKTLAEAKPQKPSAADWLSYSGQMIE